MSPSCQPNTLTPPERKVPSLASGLIFVLYQCIAAEAGSNPTIYSSAAHALLAVCGAVAVEGVDLVLS